ncbi:MAG: hypothetical protein ACFFDC_19635 [Promethearchaeota archaeon]
MGIFKKLLGKKRPVLERESIPEFGKVAEFVLWFIKNEPIVNTIPNKSINTIFNEGYRPKSGIQNNPESFNPNIKSLSEWFLTKMYIDLNMLKDATNAEFRQFIDMLDETSKETLVTSGLIGEKYDFNFEEFVYDAEIEKIPKGVERDLFKVNFLDDCVLSAEIRILAWLYHEYFGEWYKLKENRNEKNETDYIKVINDYGAALMKREQFSIAMPESMLPYSKTEIKNAIKLALKDCDDDKIGTLKFGYISLADFIPDHEADLVNAEWDEMQSKSKMSIEEFKEWMDKRGRDIIGEKWRNTWRKIDEDSEILHKEIIDFLNSIDK